MLLSMGVQHVRSLLRAACPSTTNILKIKKALLTPSPGTDPALQTESQYVPSFPIGILLNH